MASSKLKDALVSQKGVPAMVEWILILVMKPGVCHLVAYLCTLSQSVCLLVCFAFLAFPLQLKIPWGNH